METRGITMLSLNLNEQNLQHPNQHKFFHPPNLTSSPPGERNNNGRTEEEEEEKDLVTEFDGVSRMPHPEDGFLSGLKTESVRFPNGHGSQHTSAPNTPDHHLQRKSSLSSLQDRRIMTGLKKDKMELNERILREGTGRPLSYHGKSPGDNSINPLTSSSSLLSLLGSPSQSPLGLRKRQLVSPNSTPRNNGIKSDKGTRNLNGQLLNRRSLPPGNILQNRIQAKEKFDLSDLDTNLPRIDIEAIENHLRVAGEEEKKRRSDRDEIRRRLALESTEDMGEKTSGRKPSLHSRLQSSMNLQICFMNETASDSESPGSDTEVKNKQEQPGSLPFINSKAPTQEGRTLTEDFYLRQAKLQADARQALSQAKDLARIQMSHEKERRRYSPITEMVRNSLQKVGMTLSPERRRLSRQLLTEMNVAQLQVIVNDLHSHIEHLNEKLVSMLLDRDELHMEQDSMLVDIEDLTRYLTAKENSHQSLPLIPLPKSLGRK